MRLDTSVMLSLAVVSISSVTKGRSATSDSPNVASSDTAKSTGAPTSSTRARMSMAWRWRRTGIDVRETERGVPSGRKSCGVEYIRAYQLHV
eukprot:8510324-Prorocentrum_lima.AAC.1